MRVKKAWHLGLLPAAMITVGMAVIMAAGMAVSGFGDTASASEGDLSETCISEKTVSGAGISDEAVLEGGAMTETEQVYLDESWEWASNSAVHSGCAILYRCGVEADAAEKKNVTVCVNAGHGCAGGGNYQTLSHPDGTPKITGGTNANGAVYSTAISTGMEFMDGTSEASVTLMVAQELKDKLLEDGYDVLMIRDGEDVQLDNIARTLIANHCADLHVAIHFDGTQTDKGAYFCSVPEDTSYRTMEPVASCWEKHMALGQSLLQGLTENGFWLFDDGAMPTDLTQTSYSTIPSVDIELGDRASDHTANACERYAQALKDGIDLYVTS